MSDVTLYDLLGMSKERAEEIARKVRASFSKSNSPDEWLKKLIEESEVTPDNAEVFACGWFAGRYAGVLEVFRTVQKEIDKIEKDREERMEKYNPSGTDGYA
ncbi:MAG: hypothetical protein QUS07_06540 [Methanothrix sp.]|nr:hypothetical protein [Methanothrix sp.]